MNKFLKIGLLFLVGLIMLGYLVTPKKAQSEALGKANEARAKDLQMAIANLEFQKADKEKYLAELDSTASGHYYTYLLIVRVEKGIVNIKNSESVADYVEFVMPTSREFWNIVQINDVLNAGVDYKMFTFAQSFKGYSVRIVGKDKFKFNGQYNEID